MHNVFDTDPLAEADALTDLDQKVHYELEARVLNSSLFCRETSSLCGMMKVNNDSLSMDSSELKSIAK